MKKIGLLIIIFLFSVVPLWAGTKTINFAWQQDLPSPNDLQGWGLYQSSTAGGPYTKIFDVPFVSAQSEYTAGTPITVPDGQVSTLYFVLDAVDTSGNRSGKSKEVSTTIDFQPPGTPFQLKVTISTP